MLARGGADVTPAQATEGIGKTAWQALNERVAGRTVPSADFKYVTQEAQEAARKAGIKSVTPDLAASIRQREAMSKPFYEASDKTIVPLDAPMISLFERMPKGTLEKAAEIAKIEKSATEKRIIKRIYNKLNLFDRLLFWLYNKTEAKLKSKIEVKFPQTIDGEIVVRVYHKEYGV
jgi:hypothetical protein